MTTSHRPYPRPTVALVMGSFPSNTTFLLNKFLGLLAGEWGVALCCDDTPVGAARQSPVFRGSPEVRKHTHLARPPQSRLRALLSLPATLLATAATSPWRTWRYLRAGYRRFGADILRRFLYDAPLIRLNPSIVHFEFGPLAVGRMHLRELLGCSIVVSFRGYDLNFVGLERENYYAEVWASADALHLLGDDLWRRARRRGCPADKPHALIPPAIDTGFFDPGERPAGAVAGRGDRELRVLSVGRLVWKKGYEHALQAMALLATEGVRFEYRIVGDGDFVDAVGFARRQLELGESVVLVGGQTPAQVKEQMLWADVLLHPAVSEGFCNSVIEAQAMRLPVVCTDADGLAENVLDGETGFVVPRRDHRALAARLAQLAGDPALRHALGAAGRRRAVGHFQLADQILAFERLYHNVLQARTAPGDFPRGVPSDDES